MKIIHILIWYFKHNTWVNNLMHITYAIVVSTVRKILYYGNEYINKLILTKTPPILSNIHDFGALSLFKCFFGPLACQIKYFLLQISLTSAYTYLGHFRKKNFVKFFDNFNTYRP